MDRDGGETDGGYLVQRFVEHLPDCAVIILDVDGKVLTWNAGARSMLGYVADEIVGQPYSRLYEKKDVAAALGDALAKGRYEDRGGLVSKDGTRPDVLSVLMPLYDARNRHVGYGNVACDVAPLPPVDAGTTPAPRAAEPAASNTTAQVLVVDDDDQIRQIAVRQLTSLGYRVIEASNGAAALDVLARTADVDLLFVDLNMPGMNGHEVAKQAIGRQPGLKILFASGEGGPSGSDASHFLMKPYRKKELAEKVLEVLGKH